MADAVVDAERRRVAGRRVGRHRRERESQGVLLSRVQSRDADVFVSPLRASCAFGRDLPVRGVDMCAGLQDRIRCSGVRWRNVVAAGMCQRPPYRGKFWLSLLTRQTWSSIRRLYRSSRRWSGGCKSWNRPKPVLPSPWR